MGLHRSKKSKIAGGILVIGILIGTIASTASAQAKAANQYSLFKPGDARTAVMDADTKPAELGVRFTVSASGSVNSVKFFKAPGEKSSHLVSIWNSQGKRLATATSTAETAGGWQRVNLSTPLRVSPGSTYVASYATNKYMSTVNGFATDRSSGPLSTSTNSGVYTYSNGSFPASSWKASNYWVDVVFTPTNAPVVTSSTTTVTSKTPTSALPVKASGANCITRPSACGYPDATNTGWQHTGVTLKPSGSITVTQSGTVLDGLDIKGQVIVKADNVTIKRSRITSGDYYPINYDGPKGLVVEDTEIIGTNSDVTASLSFHDYTARRVNVHGGADGFKADSNVLIEDSYIHDLGVGKDTHNDGIQSTGGSNVTVRHTTCLVDQPNVDGCMQLGNEWGGISNLSVTNNLFDGGGWNINLGPEGSNRTFSNNRFGRHVGYGVISSDGQYAWTNNIWDDTQTAVKA